MAPLRLWSEKVMIRLGERASDARIRAGRIGITAPDSIRRTFYFVFLADRFAFMIQVLLSSIRPQWSLVMKFRVLFLPVLLITFTVCGTVAVLGQGTDLGTIRGTVTDASGAVVPNASVTITDQTTNSTRRTSTNSHGEYQVFGLVLPVRI